MDTVLLVLHLMLAISLVIVILIQRSSSDGLGGLGGGGGGGNAFLSGRASANLLTRTTSVIAVLFIVNSLALGVLAGHNSKQGSLLQSIEQQQKAPEPEKPAEPSVPLAE